MITAFRKAIGACIAIALLLALSACETPYKGLNGAFIADRRDDGTYDLTIRTTRYTEREQADKYALVFAAETTLEKGGRYFQVNRATEGTAPNTYQEFKDLEMNISILQEQPPSGSDQRVFDAQGILDRYGPEVKGS